MANDDDDKNCPSKKKKKLNISGFDGETLMRIRPLVSIDYVRVKNLVTDDDEKLDDALLHGSLIVTDFLGRDHVVYHRCAVLYRSILRLGKPIHLIGPTAPISALGTFIMSVNFWVSGSNHLDTVITREVSHGEFLWDPNQSSYDKPLQQDVLGEHGAVTVGYSVIRRALSATVDVVWMNESKAQMYGTVKAVSFLGGSSTTRMLFERSPNNCVSMLQPQQSLLHNPSLTSPETFPFPIPVDSYLTIEVDLWDCLSSVKQIALGSLQFTPKFGKDMGSIFGNYGEVQVSITCE